MTKVFNPREKSILYLTLGIVVFAIAFNYIFSPLLNENDLLNKEINAARLKLGKYSRLLTHKAQIQSKYSRFSSGIYSARGKDDAQVEVFSELENIAKGANIRIVDLRPQLRQEQRGPYKESLIELRSEGTSSNYLKFIYGIERSLSLLRIKKFNLSAKPNSVNLEGLFFISQISLPD